MEYELYHFGVKGMKWGVRRAQKRAARADRTIAKIERRRRLNRNVYDEMNRESREDYSGRNAKKLNKSLAANKAIYDSSEVVNKYSLAKQKAKKDPEYKKSAEYQKAKSAMGKQRAQEMLLGVAGHQRVETLKNMGVSEGKAKSRVLLENIGTGLAVSALMAGINYYSANR